MNLNLEQREAIERILNWYHGDDSFYLLTGGAGTGKTYITQALIPHVKSGLILTAPTNKAVKVLRVTLTTEDYAPVCCTIHSLLGLTMNNEGRVKKLVVSESPVSLGEIKLIVIDEASMVNTQLLEEIQKVANSWNLKILFLGDTHQLPPVGERISPVWELMGKENTFELKRVVRFNQSILALADEIKGKQSHPAPCIKFKANNSGGIGVWVADKAQFRGWLHKAVKEDYFSQAESSFKIIAWRNSTVSSFNHIVRGMMFNDVDNNEWYVGDRILFLAPIPDLKGKIVAHTDTEGTVEEVEIALHPVLSVWCYNLTVITDENRYISLWVLHEKGVEDYQARLKSLAEKAILNKRYWKEFWEFKDSFHSVQHGYAITAHRSQGSTYNTAFVLWGDILLNRDRTEAFKCLYVACTRPKNKLILVK